MEPAHLKLRQVDYQSASLPGHTEGALFKSGKKKKERDMCAVSCVILTAVHLHKDIRILLSLGGKNQTEGQRNQLQVQADTK